MNAKNRFFKKIFLGIFGIFVVFSAHSALADTKTCVKDADCSSTQRCAGGSCVEFNQSTDTGKFVPLTQLPQIKAASDASTLPAFFNSLYKISIGIAASLAVIMIMVAGVQYMTSQGSVSSNEKAKNNIQNAILGLILVLSPTIVFGIINPDILNLNIGFSGLKRPDAIAVNGNGSDAGSGSASTQLWQSTGDTTTDTDRCASDGGTLSFQCTKKDGSGNRTVSKGDTCTNDENKLNICSPSAAVAQTANTCSTSYTNIHAYTIADSANTGANSCQAQHLASIPSSCCSLNSTNSICCGLPKNGTEYEYAYYYEWKNPQTKDVCYDGTSSKLFPTQQECSSALQQEQTRGPGTKGGYTLNGSMTVVKSCEAVTDNSYVLQGPSGIAKCTK